MKKVKLIKIEPDANNNKIYLMEDNENGNFTAQWGRVEGHLSSMTYSMSSWDKKYKEKLRKGYEDVTYLFIDENTTTNNSKTEVKQISNNVIKQLVDKLQAYANKTVVENYSVTTDNVTQKQVDTAQELINNLLDNNDKEDINKILVKLFKIIPRKMKHVKDHLLIELSDLDKIIDKEQKLLDVMQGQIKVNNLQKQDVKEEVDNHKDILQLMGLTIEEVSPKEVDYIKEKLGEIKNKYKNAYKVINKRTQERFNKCLDNAKDKKIYTFWHGSRNENIWSIIDNGLVLRPTNAVISGKMFGYNIYFADKARKSYGYTSGKGSYWAKGNSDIAIMLLYDVHVGKQYHIYKHTRECYDLCAEKLEKLGNYDSIYAHGGVDLINDEFIVCKESQLTIKYLVELQG